MNAMDMITAAKARRANAGLVAKNGIACTSQEMVNYYNFRDAQPRDENGLIIMTAELRTMKKMAGM